MRTVATMSRSRQFSIPGAVKGQSIRDQLAKLNTPSVCSRKKPKSVKSNNSEIPINTTDDRNTSNSKELTKGKTTIAEERSRQTKEKNCKEALMGSVTQGARKRSLKENSNDSSNSKKSRNGSSIGVSSGNGEKDDNGIKGGMSKGTASVRNNDEKGNKTTDHISKSKEENIKSMNENDSKRDGTGFRLNLPDDTGSSGLSLLKPHNLNFESIADSITEGTNGAIRDRNFPHIVVTDRGSIQVQITQVRKYATDVVFRGVKFINTRRMLQTIMAKVSKHFMIRNEQRIQWELTYEKELKYAINNKRNSVAQDIKKALIALREKYDNIELEDFLDVRSDPANKPGFFDFFDKFVTCVSGKKSWTPSVKVLLPISCCSRVSISDEAFAELVLINYWDRWMNNKATKWTDTRIANVEYQGWDPEGHVEYNKIYRRIKKQRDNELQNETVDSLFLQRAQLEHSKKVNSQGESSVGISVEEVEMDDF